MTVGLGTGVILAPVINDPFALYCISKTTGILTIVCISNIAQSYISNITKIKKNIDKRDENVGKEEEKKEDSEQEEKPLISEEIE
jgi:hypothetical protein